MAVTKIWSIKGRAGAPLAYVMNPEKTEREFTEPERQALADVIAYAANEDKTEKHFYTTGINCYVEFARDQFDSVKQRFEKTGDIVAFHAYQSFREGEVTPDEAHAIGVQLAKELWGDRFQMVVATHVNTKCVHNHIVINSVSFVDGLKFNGCKANTRLLRDTSDRICLEHGLSVINEPKGRRVGTYLYKMEHAGIGGSGAGKTRFYVKPNIMQANCSMVVLDPKGENLRSTGWLLKRKGYQIRVLDLIQMERSHCYNPFVYLRDDNDVQRLVTNLFKATTPKGATSSDPFWDVAAQMLLLALIV